jgi:hypothetical protein
MGQLSLAVENVDRDEDHAEFDAGEIQVDHFEAVGEVDAQAVAGFQSTVSEQLGLAIAARVDVAEGIGDALEFESGGFSTRDEGQVEKIKEIQKIDDSTA